VSVKISHLISINTFFLFLLCNELETLKLIVTEKTYRQSEIFM